MNIQASAASLYGPLQAAQPQPKHGRSVSLTIGDATAPAPEASTKNGPAGKTGAKVDIIV